MSRYGNSKVSRDTSLSSFKQTEPSWFDDYRQSMDRLDKEGVQVKKDEHSLFEQINSLLGNNPKFSNVEEVVEDLKRRTGLLEFQKMANQNSETFQKIPSLQHFIDNYVEQNPGTSVDAVIFNALKVPEIKKALPQSTDVPEEVKHYINGKIAEHTNEENHSDNHNIGRVDVQTDTNTISDNNPLNSLTPKGIGS